MSAAPRSRRHCKLCPRTRCLWNLGVPLTVATLPPSSSHFISQFSYCTFLVSSMLPFRFPYLSVSGVRPARIRVFITFAVVLYALQFHFDHPLAMILDVFEGLCFVLIERAVGSPLLSKTIAAGLNIPSCLSVSDTSGLPLSSSCFPCPLLFFLLLPLHASTSRYTCSSARRSVKRLGR
jgi:hypothetical protein